LLEDPQNVEAGIQDLIEQEQASASRNPKQQSVASAETIEKCDHMRRAYQNQQASGLMTLEELRERLEELENTRKLAQADLEALSEREERIKELKRDRDDLLREMSEIVPEALSSLIPGERNELYRMLRLGVTPVSEGYEVTGTFCTSDPLCT
jgi:hypothetical protein